MFVVDEKDSVPGRFEEARRINYEFVYRGSGTFFDPAPTLRTMGDTEAELREQLTEAFEGANYPVNNPMELVPALPNGPATRFESGDVSFTAMELATKLGDVQEFPYDSAGELVDDVIEGLKEKDML
jgi:hypothetical protein